MARPITQLSLSRLGIKSTPLNNSTRQRCFSTSPLRPADYTHCVIGGGAVGLAIARSLASKPNTSTLLLERHSTIGTETSSRNSEVIHAGLYYGHDTLKTRLCIEGKQLLYDLCSQKRIPHRNTGKWIVAQDDAQMGEVEKVHDFASSIGVPTRFLSRREIAEREPDVRAQAGVLESSSTGIVDSHALMTFLEADFLERGGEEAFNTTVTCIEALAGGERGYRVHVRPTTSSDSTSEPESSIEVETLINSAGLGAIPISNLVLPPSRHRKPFYAKGSYFSYAASHPRPKTLLYPAPVPGLGGLGTHLTLDMSGRVRFGPDVEWVDDPHDLGPNPARLGAALDMIQSYLPGIDRDAVDLDYCGIRPKLGKTSGTAGPTFADFYIREEEGFRGFVNLLGIESPGLTSCLAIAKMVEGMLYRDVSGKGATTGEQPKFELHH
jgi:2-hydroxyglutarate dehydrogenase